jgi:hypothetical protein
MAHAIVSTLALVFLSFPPIFCIFTRMQAPVNVHGDLEAQFLQAMWAAMLPGAAAEVDTPVLFLAYVACAVVSIGWLFLTGNTATILASAQLLNRHIWPLFMSWCLGTSTLLWAALSW